MAFFYRAFPSLPPFISLQKKLILMPEVISCKNIRWVLISAGSPSAKNRGMDPITGGGWVQN